MVVGSDGSGRCGARRQLAEITAWMQHQLVFHHRPLGEVAAEFNRYNVGQIELRSPSLREQEVTGTFRSNDVASFVAVLAGTLVFRSLPTGPAATSSPRRPGATAQ